MAGGTYPDGFPLSPLEAINFSYFLSDTEKEEWREWLKTATSDQQLDLVNTLHDIWTENQRDAVPKGFDNKQEPKQAEQTPAPAPAPAPKQAEPKPQEATAKPLSFPPPPQFKQQTQASSPTPPPFSGNPAPKPPSNNQAQAPQATSQVAPQKPPQKAPEPPQKPKFTFKEDGDTRPGHQNSPEKTNQQPSDPPAPPRQTNQSGNESGNKKVENQPNETQKEVQKPKFNNNSSNTANNSQQQPKQQNGNLNSNKQQKPPFNKQSSTNNQKPQNGNQSSATQAKKTQFFDVDRLASPKTKSTLENIYNEFSTTKQNQDAFMEKLMQTILEYESVNEYFDVIAGRMIQLNDTLVKQNQEIVSLRSSLKNNSDQNKFINSDFQAQIDELKDSIERLTREVRRVGQESLDATEEVQKQFSGYEVDIYKKEGLLERVSSLSSRIGKLESSLGSNNDSEIKNRLKPLDNNSKSNINTNQNQRQSFDNKNSDIKPIDLRSRV